MIVTSIIILCAEEFLIYLPKSSQVKFSYLVYFLVNLGGGKMHRGKDK